MKKIVHIIDSLEMGGAQRIVFELATRLKGNYAVEVIALTGSEKDFFYGALQGASIPVQIIRKEHKSGRGLVKKLQRYFAQSNPDIVHTHLFAADVWGTRAAQHAGVPHIISTEHNINMNEGWLKHRFKAHAYAHNSGVVAISEGVEAYVRNFCPRTIDRMHLIPNGIDMERFTAIAHKPTLSTPANIAVVARLEEQKGHADLLNALPHVQQPYQLHIIGDGSLRTALEQQVTENGLKEQVVFEGMRSDVERVYAQADIIVVPSRFEGFGLAAVEAMASARPVILSNIDGLREIVQPNESGVLVDMRAPQAVAEAIDQLTLDDALRVHLGKAAREAVQKKYTLKKMIESYNALYQSFV